MPLFRALAKNMAARSTVRFSRRSETMPYLIYEISIHNLHIVISKRSVFLNIDCSDELYVHYSPRVFLNTDCLDITVCTLLASRVSQH